MVRPTKIELEIKPKFVFPGQERRVVIKDPAVTMDALKKVVDALVGLMEGIEVEDAEC